MYFFNIFFCFFLFQGILKLCLNGSKTKQIPKFTKINKVSEIDSIHSELVDIEALYLFSCNLFSVASWGREHGVLIQRIPLASGRNTLHSRLFCVMAVVFKF